jgi:glucose 1-dehydrogenase
VDATGQWFTDRTAIVTGAARGIGRATAELLASLGARVVAVDKDEEALRDLSSVDGCIAWPGDLTSGTEQLAAQICDRHGPVQLLVNNVGIDTPKRFLELDQDDFDIVFETNLRGPWFLTRVVTQRLVDARLPGSVVFVSSLHDHRIRTRPHYSASKAAVAMLVRELAAELGPRRIRVNAVSPGRVLRSLNASLTPERAARGRRHVPLGRVGQPDDVARMVAVLLSDEWAAYVTGANVPVDGGLGLHSWSVDEPTAGHGRALPARVVGRLKRGFG